MRWRKLSSWPDSAVEKKTAMGVKCGMLMKQGKLVPMVG